MKEKKIKIIGLILSFILLTSMSIQISATKIIRNESNLGSKESQYLWQDDFIDSTKIDTSLSYSWQLEDETVIMINTYPFWTNPSFTRMKPIQVTNTGQTNLENYVISLTIPYDSDMQNDFDDLRFVKEDGSYLDYWIKSKILSTTANVWVEIPTVLSGQSIFVYMLYGYPSATSQSSFTSVFSWADRTSPDTMVSFKAYTEGAWDPDVAYGDSRFLVAWEERVGPEDINLPLPHYERTLYSTIYGRTYNITGGDPYPIPEVDDIKISLPGVTDYHAENPAIAFGAGKFFVAWEENPANQPLNRYEADIKGAIVNVDGSVTNRFTICSSDLGQFDPQVAYDASSNRFLVVWEDARYGYDDYDVRGRLYNSNGYPQGADFSIAYDTNFQGEPWVCSDNQWYFFVVYEDGTDAAQGPFNLKARRVDSNGSLIGSIIPIATGSETVDNIFPAVSYNPSNQLFFVTWNDADISANPNHRDGYDGNIWGKMLTRTGTTVVSNFIIEPGTSFIRTDSLPYFDSLFFVCYNGIVSGTQDIFGRIVSPDGSVLTSRTELSDGSSQNVDWNNLAVGDGHIFVTWEDERDLLSDYADAFQYVWKSVQNTGLSSVTYTFGEEKQRVLQSQVVSIPIAPDEWYEWEFFSSVFSAPSGTTLTFDILDETGNVVLKPGVIPGENISSVTSSIIRLRATFSRPNPSLTPVLDSWNVTAIVGTDIFPPETTIEFDPAAPNGNNGWYVSPVTLTFTATDPDSPPENITTYYKINDFNVEIYNPQSPPVIDIQGANNCVEYWSDDLINEETHHIVDGIKIDLSQPTVTINKPPNYVSPGLILINGSVTEYTSGSGIERLKLWLNDELLIDTSYSGEYNIWFETTFTADIGESYDIYVECYDNAGLYGQDRRNVTCSNTGVYEVGYIYLFDNPPAGPKPFLVSLGMAIAVDYDTLFVLLPEFSNEAAKVEFVAQRSFLKENITVVDDDMSDGCFIDLKVKPGIYSIRAYVYDSYNTLIEEKYLITKILILLL